MAQLPDLRTMTTEEIGDWFLRGDTSTLLATATRPSEPMVHISAPAQKPARTPRHPGRSAAADDHPRRRSSPRSGGQR